MGPVFEHLPLQGTATQSQNFQSRIALQCCCGASSFAQLELVVPCCLLGRAVLASAAAVGGFFGCERRASTVFFFQNLIATFCFDTEYVSEAPNQNE
jgi:hypothetical protein